MNDYTQPSAFKHVDTVSLNAESLKFVKEMSDGPYYYEQDGKFAVLTGPGIIPGEKCSWKTTHEILNMAWHSRDAEVDALKSENERLKVWNETLERTCSERGKQVDRHLAELAALRNRLHVAEELLTEWNRYPANHWLENETELFLQAKGGE
jgi:hypothetical protein